MRKFLIPLAAAASTLAIASPASAQWYPQPVPHAAPYAYGHANFGHARALQARVDHLQREIRRLANYRMISPRDYRNLRQQSRSIELRLRRDMRDGYGLTPSEAFANERRIVRLEQRVQQRVAMNMRYGNRYAYGYGRRW